MLPLPVDFAPASPRLPLDRGQGLEGMLASTKPQDWARGGNSESKDGSAIILVGRGVGRDPYRRVRFPPASRDDNLNDPIVGEENAVLADASNVPPQILRFAIDGWTAPTASVCQLRREPLGQARI